MHACMRACARVCVTMRVGSLFLPYEFWWSISVIRLGGKYLYPLSHLPSPFHLFGGGSLVHATSTHVEVREQLSGVASHSLLRCTLWGLSANLHVQIPNAFTH